MAKSISTDLVSEKMYEFYQTVAARTDVSCVYVDGVYDLMNHIAKWLDKVDKGEA